MAGEPDPKPRGRYRNQREWNEIVRRLIARYRECECGCGRAAMSGHHFVPRGAGGDDVEANCIVLAGSGTTLCHGAVEGNRVVVDGERITPEQVRAALRLRVETKRHDTMEYAIERTGSEWIDRHYPRQ